MLRRLLATTDDYAPTIARVALGAIILPHGLQKTAGLFGGFGFEGTMGFMTGQLGIPAFLAVLAIAAESLGAVALVVGLAGRVAALGVAGVMAVAAGMVHAGNGFFMNWNGNQTGEGFEYHLLAIALAAIVVARGSGAWSLDRVLSRRLEQLVAAEPTAQVYQAA